MHISWTTNDCARACVVVFHVVILWGLRPRAPTRQDVLHVYCSLFDTSLADSSSADSMAGTRSQRNRVHQTAASSSTDSISADSRSVDSSSSESSDLLRLEIRRFKGVRSEMQIWMFGGSAVQSSEVHCFRVQTFGSLQFQKCIG